MLLFELYHECYCKEKRCIKIKSNYRRKQLVRKTLMRAKAQSERPAEQRQESPEEYAQTEVQQGISDVAARTGNTAKSTARMSYRKFRAMQEKRKNLTLRCSTQSASKPTEKEKVTVPTQTERREMFKKQRFRQKAISAKTPAPQAPVSPSATPAPPPYRAQMQQRLKRQHLSREAVRRYLQKQTAATAAGNTSPIVTHAPKLPTISNKQATVEAISRGVHYIAAKIKALLSQTVRRAAQSLLALLGAGGVVLLLTMVIGAAAAVIGSPMGILFADESGDPNSIRIAEIVAETNADFGTAINDIVSAHPECSETTMEYDYEDGHTWASYWPEVLAVFAVQNNLNNDGDVVVIDEGKKRLIQDTFWAMHEISAEVEEVTATPEPTEDEPDPEPVTQYILHITVSSKSVDALADLYRFTQDQRDILHQLLSEEMRPSLLALCGGIAVADGELCWPLPGHTYISCHFGEVDAFGNAGHRGTDIPAPEGTPILAAHSGTVLVSGWNDSYGNQVLLDNGAGLSTRYAHMTQTAVTAGEAVTAGQVIGYVGNTGDSTGNHLHFEVMQNGVRMNPLELVFGQ
ncbi:peptidoglycan DD-metalloendopeptidase family protein [Gemmiger sp.]